MSDRFKPALKIAWARPLARPAFDLLAGQGTAAKLSILIFHRVLPSPDPLFPDEIDTLRFDRICTWLREWFNVLPLDDAAQLLREGRLPRRALAITFDDGYADNHTQALPILQRHRLTATFFVATGFLDGGCMFNDLVIEAIRRTKMTDVDLSSLGLPKGSRLSLGDTAARRKVIDASITAIKHLELGRRGALAEELAERLEVTPPHDLMMRSDQVRQLHVAGMQVGAHTVSHPIMARLDAAVAEREVRDSKLAVESLLGCRVKLFAYPNGRPDQDYSHASVEAVRRAGFEAAVTTAWGCSSLQSDPLQLPRFTPWDRSALGFGLRLARNLRSGPEERATR